MEKQYLLSLITRYSDIQLSIINSSSFSIHSTSMFSNRIFDLFDELFVKFGDGISIVFNNSSSVTITKKITNKKYNTMYSTDNIISNYSNDLNISYYTKTNTGP